MPEPVVSKVEWERVRQSGLGEHQRRTCGGGSGGVRAAEEQQLYGVANCGGEEECRPLAGPGPWLTLFLLCFAVSC